MMPKKLGEIFQFPIWKPAPINPVPSVPLTKVPRYYSDVQTLDPDAAANLKSLTDSILVKSSVLIEYMDENRDQAKMSGVETIAIELSAIMEGGRLHRVSDALEEASVHGTRPAISVDAFSKLRRAEQLTLEADRTMKRHMESPPPAPSPSMGQASSPPSPSTVVVSAPQASPGPSIPLILLGVIGAGALLAAVVYIMFKERPVTTPS